MSSLPICKPRRPGFLVAVWFCLVGLSAPRRHLITPEPAALGPASGLPAAVVECGSLSGRRTRAGNHCLVLSLGAAHLSAHREHPPFSPRSGTKRASSTLIPRPGPCWRSVGVLATAKGSVRPRSPPMKRTPRRRGFQSPDTDIPGAAPSLGACEPRWCNSTEPRGSRPRSPGRALPEHAVPRRPPAASDPLGGHLPGI